MMADVASVKHSVERAMPVVHGDREMHTRQMLASLVPLFTLSLVAIAVRIYTRKYILKKVKFDDYLLAISWVLLVCSGISGYFQLTHGNLSGKALETMNPHLLRLPWIQGAVHWVYKLPLNLSAALLYLSSIPNGKSKAPTSVVAAIGGAAAIVGGVGSVAFGAQDPNEERFIGPGLTRPQDVLFAITGSLDIITTFILIFIPLPWIKQLALNHKEKVALLIVVLGGIFVAISAILTLVTAHQYFHEPDSLKRWFDLMLWGSLKGHFSIAALAALGYRPLLHHHFPRFFVPLDAPPEKNTTTSQNSQQSMFVSGKAQEIIGLSGLPSPKFRQGSAASVASVATAVSYEKEGRGSPFSEPLASPERRGFERDSLYDLEDIVRYARGREAMDAPEYGVPRSSFNPEVEVGFAVPQWGER